MPDPFLMSRAQILPMMRTMSREIYEQVGRDLYSQSRRQLDAISEPLSGADAANYLARQSARVKADLLKQAQAFPSHWWLLLLRYISPVIFGSGGGNYSRYRGCAERMSARSTRRLDSGNSAGLLGEPQVKRTIRFVTTSALYEDLHIAAGCVSAGAALHPDGEQRYELVLDEGLTAAFHRYDRQLRASDQGLLTRMGASYLEPLNPAAIDLNRTLVALSALELPFTRETFRTSELADVLQFAPVMVVLNESVMRLPWADLPHELGRRARVLAAVMRLAFVDIGERPTLWERLHQTGLINRPREEWEAYADGLHKEANDWGDAVFPGAARASKTDVVTVVTEISGGRSGRYYGPAIRVGHDFFSIDLLTTWLRLESTIAACTAGGGVAPNLRAKMWEEAVQRAIDGTRWRPGPPLAAAVSRPLKLNGRVFSDLDAAGAHHGNLLIVSCKSWQMTERYDNLDYSTRRNRAADTIKAAKKLHADIEKISTFANRLVAPHSLAGVQGVVCTSMPILLTPDELDELDSVAPGIDVLTLPELKARLDETEPKQFDPHAWSQYLAHSYRHNPHLRNNPIPSS
ncbi:hypothetical protein ACFXGA_11250 [Actinosynnema sp. NPDC059335]|uniref:hypothetical protein n=1 Tax=Actinosynnema sp. NPDC059335 TaxID=3346804 RepID=UPI00366C8B82